MKLTKEQCDAAPENAEWFAVDSNGKGWFYTQKPQLDEMLFIGLQFLVGNCIYCDPTDWQNSLQQRPKA